MAASEPVESKGTEEDANPDDDVPLLECLSCNEQEGFLVNPKTLHCGHIFCVTCLGNHCVDNVITCFKCGQKTTSSIEYLPSAMTKPTFCGTCEKIDKIQYKTASMYCIECDRKYCASHFKMHNAVNNHHQMLTIRNYLKSSYAQDMRFCEAHKDRVLSLGCSKCWMITCPKCLTANLTCDQGNTGTEQHSLASIEEVAEELRASVEPLKTAAEDKFDEIAALVKKITIMLSDWDTETEHAVRLIRQTRDQQIAAIQEKYTDLESDYTKKRNECKEKITSYIADRAGPSMSDFLFDIKTLRANLTDLHPVDLIHEREEIEKKINELISVDFPVLLLSSSTRPSQTGVERREPEIELLPVDEVMFGDEIGGIFKNPPSSVQLVREVDVRSYCPSACHFKDYTYIGHNSGVIDKIDKQGNITSGFISEGYSSIVSLRADEDQLYVLVLGSPYTVYVHDMSGKKLRSWKHSDKSGRWGGNKMALVSNQLVVADSANQQIQLYNTTTGDVHKTIPCLQITAITWLAMCEGGGNSVVISDHASSKVFKLNLTTGVILWTHTNIQNPQGVTLLGPLHVAVSASGNGTKVWILNLSTGEKVKELTDTSISSSSNTFALALDGHTLIIPRWECYKVLYYKLM